jgi:hypothetical protein
MGIFDKLVNGKKESEAIIKMVEEQDLFGRKIYFDDFFYYADGGIDKKGENVYIKKEIEYVIVNNSWDTDNIIYSIDGLQKNTRVVDRQVISMVYLKLQDYIREFES